MKHSTYGKLFSLLLTSLLVCLTVSWAQARTQKKPTPTPTPEKKISIEETILRREGKTTVVLKPEFEAVKQGTSVVVRKKGGTIKVKEGTVTGKIVCKCTPDGSGERGGCDLTADSAFRVTGVATGSCTCELTVVQTN
jgi:hypothetical protein